jgi:hypothetical protein
MGKTPSQWFVLQNSKEYKNKNLTSGKKLGKERVQRV